MLINKRQSRCYVRYQRRFLTEVKNSAKKFALVFLCCYTILYVAFMNGVYVTNYTSKTSINVMFGGKHFRQFINHRQRNTSGSGSQVHVPEIGEDSNRLSNSSVIKGSKPDALYDHPVLRRIDRKQVFYISAIADNDVTQSTLDSYVDPNHFEEIDQEHTEPDNSNEDYAESQEKVIYGDYELNDVPKSKDFIRRTNPNLTESDFKYGIVTLNGWEGSGNAKTMFYCCYKYDGVFQRQGRKILYKNIWNQISLKIMKATQFICPLLPLNGTILKPEYPVEVALSNSKCDKLSSPLKFAKVDWKLKVTNEPIAICSKIIFGNYPPGKLIEWFEFNKLMGADKILLYTYNVSSITWKVLNHYEKEGLLITREYDYPIKTLFPRKLGGKNMLAFEDEQVTVFDCAERFHNYSFVAVLDLDEFLVPTEAGNETWRTMLSKLQENNPTASGFSFHTQIFTLDWGVTNPEGKLFVTRYIKRTSTMWDRKKNMIIPSRVQRGSVWTHAFASKRGYEPAKVPTNIANLFHYRSCRPQWIATKTCTSRRKRWHDTTMLSIMERIQDRIISIKENLLKV